MLALNVTVVSADVITCLGDVNVSLFNPNNLITEYFNVYDFMHVIISLQELPSTLTP